MEVAAKKGTVIPLASLFPAEDAEKAARRVEETLTDNQAELDRVRGFISDNTSLINLVQRLPEDLHHDIMVPFGKAAFFPGRLIHTNEFLVLLGEGYYAERTSKQTVEILKRRGKGLDSQAESMMAMMNDLKAEASFFGATASEAAEGLVEIREDYVEENYTERESQSGPPKEDDPSFCEADEVKVGVEDEEFARMMSRLEELEKEELEAECGNGRDEDNAKVAIKDEEYPRIMSRWDELEKEEPEAEVDNETDEDEKIKDDFDQLWNQRSLDNNLSYSENYPSKKLLEQTRDKKSITEGFLNMRHPQQDLTDQLNCIGLAVQPVPKDEISHGTTEKAFMIPEVKENVQAATSSGSQVAVQTSTPRFDSRKAFTGSIIERTHDLQTKSQQTVTSSQVPVQTSKPAFDSHKAFPGSIIERTHNIQTNLSQQTATSSQSLSSQPSKPVSRFKMQRR